MTTTGSILRAQGRQGRRAPRPGTVLDGRWKLLRVVSNSLTGTRYAAHDLRSDHAVQVVVTPEPVGWDAAWLDHPYVLMTVAVGTSEDDHYVVQEACAGGTLDDWAGPALDLGTLLSQMVGIADALDRAHDSTGEAHGALGLHSLWRTPAGRIRLADLALAGGPMPEAAETFAAPERLAGHAVDLSADQYALAALLRTLATGVGPDTTLSDPLPRAVEQLLRIGMAEHPSWRFPSMRGMKRALERAVTEVGGATLDGTDVTTFVERQRLSARVPPPNAFRAEPEPAPLQSWEPEPVTEPDVELDELQARGTWPYVAVASVAAGLGFGVSLLAGLAVLALVVAMLLIGVESPSSAPLATATPTVASAAAEPTVAGAAAAASEVPSSVEGAMAAIADMAGGSDEPIMAPGTPDWTQAPVSFAYDSWEIRPGPRFESFAEDVRTYRGTVHLTGHTDTRGSAEANEVMGLGRAWAVEVGLLAYEVPDAKVEIGSAGETAPLTNGTRAADHARNRRVSVDWR